MIAYNWKVLPGWVIFLVVLVITWDLSISSMLQAMENVTADATPSSPAPRVILFLAGAYATCRVALLLSLSMLLLFCTLFYRVCTWVFQEGVLFDPVQPAFLTFHVAVFLGTLMLALTFACVSATDKDLASPERVQSVVVREALSMAFLSLVAYLGVVTFAATRS
ncbi:MAG: hypothetical protein WDW38_006577 [Sanguina aurantia]